MDVRYSEYPWIYLSKRLPTDTLTTIRKYSPHSIVTWIGDDCNHCYYVKSGAIRYYITNENGSTQTIGIVLPGAFLGEATMLKGEKWLFTIETIRETELLSIERSQLLTLLENDSNFTKHLVEAMATKILSMHFKLTLSDIPVQTKVERLLEQLVYPLENEGVNFKQFTHQEIADLIGCHRVTVTKIINKIEEKMQKDHKDISLY